MRSESPAERHHEKSGARRTPIGRDSETGALSELVLNPALSVVTVTGPGGVGKTTLAMHVARLVDHSFAGGVHMVPLAQVAETDFLFHAIARRLDVHETGQTSIADQLVERLRDRRTLLVLDTFEHLLEAAADVAWLVEACPDLTCLVTSRSPLHVREEQEFPLRPLSTGDDGSNAAVALFEDRAKAANPAFAITAENADDIAAICRRLDGLPLAIELAAARVRLLPAAVMLRKLDDPLPLLASGARDAPARQRTMRDTIAWSYDLLDPESQRLFRSLSVFRGTFALDAVEAIAAAMVNVDVLATLSTLIDQSLVEPAGIWSEARYRLLDTVREFGWERLGNEDERERVLQHHAMWFLSVIEQAATFWWGPDHFEWLEQIERDVDNLRSALNWFQTRGDIVSAARLAIAMYGVWRVHGPVSEAWNCYQRILAASDELPLATRARLHVCHSGMEWVFADRRGSAWDATGYQLALQSGDEDALAFALVYEGATAESSGEWDRAEAALGQLVQMGRNAPAGSFVCQWTAAGLEHLASLERDRGNLERALTLAQEAVDAAERRGFAWGYPMILATLADIERQSGLRDIAIAHYREAIRIVWPQDQPRHSAAILAGSAALVAEDGEPVLAARLLGAADRLIRSDGVVLPAYSRKGYEKLLEHLRAQIGDQALGEELDHGRSWSSDQAKSEAETSLAALSGAMTAITQPTAHPLSARELEVLRLVVEGKTDAEIAEALFISRSTAGDHVSSILTKLDVPNRVAAAVFAIRHELV